MKLHLRRWSEKKTWCGRKLASVKLARSTTRPDAICDTCATNAEAEQQEFVRLAELIDAALWKLGRRSLA